MEALAQYSHARHTAFVFASEVEDLEQESNRVYVANLFTSQVLVLETSGAVIWEVLKEPHSLAELVQTIAEIFDQSEEIVRDSVLDFVTSLQEQGFLALVG